MRVAYLEMIFLCVICAVPACADAHSSIAGKVFIADGDCAALQAAIDAGTAQAPARVALARGGSYACSPSVHGAAEIEASGATLSIACGSALSVESGARLSLRNAKVIATSCGQAKPSNGRLIHNRGRVDLDAVTLEASPDATSIYNEAGASLSARNVTGVGGVASQGSLGFYNSTWNGSVASTGSAVVLSNTIFQTALAHQSCAISGTAVTSLGGNVLDSVCPWALPTDTQTADFGFGVYGANGGILPTHALADGSVARGKGIATYCLPTDARGKARQVYRCAAGAYDDGQSPPFGSVNGSYFDSQADGHYVSMELIDTGNANPHVLVYWNTFDRNGNPAWIYGVGDYVTSSRIHAEMSQNVGGHLQPGGPATGSSARAWGSVDIDISDCGNAQFLYNSPLSEFGDGQFSLNRLTKLYDFGCISNF